ncbi:MAG TPA: AAA family ATPase [Thermoanaerobaculia bacterium]|nr:AAA family ATPase [Thermoanaerobaculia bacterium]
MSENLADGLERLRRRLEEQGWECEETHISVVLLGPREVWKVKKPVALGFLDFSTLARRRSACEAEVALNRRLAPDVYLGVEPITERDGEWRLGGDGEPVEWAVRMRRMPRAARADALLAAGELGAERLEQVARRLAEFHAACRSDERTARLGGLEAVERNVRENFRQVAPFLLRYLQPAQAGEVREWQLQFLRDHRELFERRTTAGRVRDGHGDLRLEHVYLEGERRERVVVLDCIEFNDRFRYADVCADLAFLAMDLAWHGRVDLAEGLLARYAEEADDFDLYSLVDFYESYRAFVRGKVLGMTAGAAGPHALVERTHREARRYFRLATTGGRRPLLEPRLIAVGGVLATGKSTVARGLGRALACPVIAADPTRKHMLGIATTEHRDDAPFRGAYSPEMSVRVYAELLRRAEVVLRSGRSAVLDASFRGRRDRGAARALADRLGVPFLFVECRAPRAVLERRLRARRAAGATSESDGRLEILDQFLARWEQVGEEVAGSAVGVDTSAAEQTVLAQLLAGLPRWPAAGDPAR